MVKQVRFDVHIAAKTSTQLWFMNKVAKDSSIKFLAFFTFRLAAQ